MTMTPSISSPNASTPAISEESLPPITYPDRRKRSTSDSNSGPPGVERRQFGNSYNNLSSEGRELAEAIDRYKIQYRRRYVTTDELLSVLKGLGYSRP
ncbi:hypothetical protein SH501x_005286 [Pirellulaceae bacterium SH501]